MNPSITIVECPRDAMQGISAFIPTNTKIEYLNALLEVGFDILDFGSFVSPKAIPQLADTSEVLVHLNRETSATKLLAIVANLRGAKDAIQFQEIDYLGYPFSISETFQERNTRKNVQESWMLVNEIYKRCQDSKCELVIYLSMAFGNPYGDPWSIDIILEWLDKMQTLGINTIALADTVGTANVDQIGEIMYKGINTFPEAKIGAHFHAHPSERLKKIVAAYDSGCRRFDVALQGYGGCPFAEDKLIGNIATESLLSFCANRDIPLTLNQEALLKAQSMVGKVFEEEH